MFFFNIRVFLPPEKERKRNETQETTEQSKAKYVCT